MPVPINGIGNFALASPDLAYWALQLIYGQYPNGGQKTWQEVAAALWPGRAVAYFNRPRVGLLPQLQALSYAGLTLAVSEGINPGTMVLPITQGYLAGPDPSMTIQTNEFWYTWGLDFLAWLVSSGLSANNIVIAGHSGGGASAAVVAGLMNSGSFPHPQARNFLQIAAPRAISIESDSVVNQTPSWRWEIATDPVSIMCPHENEAPLIFYHLSNAQARTLNAFGHVNQCSLITSPGTWATATNTGLTVAGIISDLVSMGLGTGGFSNVQHEVNFYLASLLPGINQGGTAYPVPVAQGEVVYRPTHGDTQQQELAAQAVVQSEQTQTAVYFELPPSPNRFTVARAGRIHSVQFQGTSIAVAPTRRRAHALARHLNNALRVAQTCGLFNSQAFLACMSSYLVNAKTMPSVFVPTIADGGNTPLQAGPTPPE